MEEEVRGECPAAAPRGAEEGVLGGVTRLPIGGRSREGLGSVNKVMVEERGHAGLVCDDDIIKGHGGWEL